MTMRHIRIATACAIFAGGFGEDARDELGCSSGARNNTTLDVDAVEANVVVSLGTCSGILLTPQIVATAAHCVHGSRENGDCRNDREPPLPIVGIGTVGQGPPQFASIAAEARIPVCLERHHNRAHDVALVYLAEPVTTASIVARKYTNAPAVPRVVRPKLAAPPCDGLSCDAGCGGGTWPWAIGVAGYGGAGQGGSGQRHVRVFKDASFDVVDEDDDFVWEKDADRWVNQQGDSGGPLFVEGEGGRRDVIGIYSGTLVRPFVPFVEIMRWADVTRGTNREWILGRVRESNVPPGLRHSAAWLRAHGKSDDAWWGELDYSGPCDADRDRDCDGFWDEGPASHDNCPPRLCGDDLEACANPDQADRDDDGVGDACADRAAALRSSHSSS